jgi:hypothetical protein
MLTPEEIAQIRKRCEEASPGPKFATIEENRLAT